MALCTMTNANPCANPYPHLNCGWFQRYSANPGLCGRPSPVRTMETVQAGDWVEFEPGSYERVVAVELNHDDEPGENLSDLTARKHWGRSMVVTTSYDDQDNTGISGTSLHVRREKSPCLNDPFGRKVPGQPVYAIR